MRDNLFWRSISVVALVLGFMYVGSRMVESTPVKAAGEAVSVITAPESAKYAQLYVVDSSRQIILVYGTGSNVSSFALLAGRSMRYDIEAASKGEIPFNARGYSVAKLKKELEKKSTRR